MSEELCETYSLKDSAVQQFTFFRKPKETLRDGGFIIYKDIFRELIGQDPRIKVIAENSSYPFAHEAGVFIPSTESVFITSNHVRINGEKKIKISKVWKQENEDEYTCEEIEPASAIKMANGGVNYRDGVLFCDQGTMNHPGGLIYMEAEAPYKTTPILTNYNGRWFNSVNDVVVHSDGSIWFTDPAYGFEQDIRPYPQLPNQIYRFDPVTGDIRPVADGINKPNGLCFSPDESTLYITDTDGVNGREGYNPHRAASIYAFGVTYFHNSPFLIHKRLFAMADEGIPDGIKCDNIGNIYSGCGDGVHVWTQGGILMGKIYVPGGCSNFCFGKEGELFLLNEHKMYRAQLSKDLKGDLLKI